MNTVKKIISFAFVIFISFRLIVISVSASFAAPFVAEETLKTALIEGMMAGGADYTRDELEARDLDDLKNEFEVQMTNNPNFKPKEAAPKVFPFIPFSDTVLGEFLSSMDDAGSDLYDKINPTYTVPEIDLQGSGAVLKLYYRNQGSANAEIDSYKYVYCEYIDVQSVGDGTNIFYCCNPVREEAYNLKGELRYERSLIGNSVIVESQSKVGDNFMISGDCRRLEDGSQIDTTGEAIPVIGEAGGTQVTPDMLNPDGTVTIDGTTYYPKDFIDWDKFKDTAIIDLLNEILKSLDNSYVIDDSVPDIGFDDVAVDVPAELSDFTTLGIFNVFPFCLPKDFVRGMYLFKAKPEVPHFETEIKIPAFLNVPEQNWKIEIDFKEFEPLAKITRWISLTSFVYVLILITPKIVKGAG